MRCWSACWRSGCWSPAARSPRPPTGTRRRPSRSRWAPPPTTPTPRHGRSARPSTSGRFTIELDPAPTAFVVTRWGVHYLAEGSLWFTDGTRARRVARVNATELSLSPDGRLLGLMDSAHGPRDEFDTALAVPVVLDAQTGEQVLRVPAPDEELEDLGDLADLYEETDVGFLGFDADAAYVADPVAGGLRRLPLDGGDPRAGPPGTAARPRRGARSAGPAARGAWRLAVARRGETATREGWLAPWGRPCSGPGDPGAWYDPEDGAAHPVETGDRFFYLGGWVDRDVLRRRERARVGAGAERSHGRRRVHAGAAALPGRRHRVRAASERPVLVFGAGRPAPPEPYGCRRRPRRARRRHPGGRGRRGLRGSWCPISPPSAPAIGDDRGRRAPRGCLTRWSSPRSRRVPLRRRTGPTTAVARARGCARRPGARRTRRPRRAPPAPARLEVGQHDVAGRVRADGLGLLEQKTGCRSPAHTCSRTSTSRGLPPPGVWVVVTRRRPCGAGREGGRQGGRRRLSLSAGSTGPRPVRPGSAPRSTRPSGCPAGSATTR